RVGRVYPPAAARADGGTDVRGDGSVPDADRRGDQRRGRGRHGEQGNPVQNQTRNLWVTATVLTTALNTAFLAERIALFAIVMGVALLLTGIGFLVLTVGGALRAPAAPMSPTS